MGEGLRIGIVGGGASAVCIIDALSEYASRPGSLTIFDPTPQLWRGRAFQHDADVVLVNSPAEDMSVRHRDSGHFEKWLRNRYYAEGQEVPDFAPRAVFGDYLAQVAEQGISRLSESGWNVEIVRSAVVRANRVEKDIVLHSRDGANGLFDYVILAVGGGRPHDTYGLAGAPNFIEEPYPIAQTLAPIGTNDPVAVIGTGLTAVDTVIALESSGHGGPITMLSRQGMLPAVRQLKLAYEPKHFVPARLHGLAGSARRLEFAAVIDLLRIELLEAGAELDDVWEEISRSKDEEPVARLRRGLADVESERTSLRVLQTAVHVCGPDLWPLLLDNVKKDVLGPYYRTLMSLCCPMPPSSAQTLLRLVDAGQVEIVSGTFSVARCDDGGFKITASSRTISADHAVNCVNAARDRIPAGANALMKSLYEQGLAVPHADGGLCVQTGNSLCNSPENGDSHRLYAIGDITGGTFFFTFGIPSLVDRCHDIVTDILLTDKKDISYA